MTHRALVAAACAIAATASACGGTGDKAGGGTGAETVTLRLGASSDAEPRELAAAANRGSGGAIRLRNVRRDDRTVVSDVRRGAVDLAIVSSYALDRAGATSLRALAAPFVVDSLAFEARVLESPLAERMLAGVDDAGVVGVGLLLGALGRPVGLRRATVTAADYRGAVVGIEASPLAERSFVALGARTRVPDFPRDLGAIDVADLTMTSLDVTGYDDIARSIAADVVLRPHVLVLIANNEAFAALDTQHRALLRQAARDTLDPAQERLASQELVAITHMCERDRVPLVSTTPAQRTELRRAVRRVFDDVGADPLTRELVAAIERMRGRSSPLVLRCSHPATPRRQATAGPLDGTWEWSVTTAELRSAGETPAGIANNAGRWRLVVRDERFELRGIDAGDVYRGSFVVDAERIVAQLDGQRTTDPSWQYTWSLFRGRLTLSPVEGAAAAAQVVAKPLIRVD